MPKVSLYKQDGTEAGNIELNESVFGIEPNEHVIHEAVLKQNAAKRHANHAVKNRGEVRGGGKKPWRQKGTGRARQGSTRSPQWVGGGVVFGPTTARNYKTKLPKKVRRLALKSALSSKVQGESLLVLEDLQLEKPKTKEVVQLFDALNVNEKALIITETKNENVIRSANNLKSAKVIAVGELSVLDLVEYNKVILTKEAAEKAGEVLA